MIFKGWSSAFANLLLALGGRGRGECTGKGWRDRTYTGNTFGLALKYLHHTESKRVN